MNNRGKKSTTTYSRLSQTLLQQPAIAESELQANEDLIAEREIDIDQIVGQAQEINQLFVEIANLLPYQSDLIDGIAQNIDNADKKTQAGVNELEKVAPYQSRCVVS